MKMSVSGLRGKSKGVKGGREKRPRSAKTKSARVPNLYVDNIPDSPKRHKSKYKDSSCKVPIALHPHSPGLVSAFFPSGALSENQVKSVSAPSLATLRKLQQHPSETLDPTVPVEHTEGWKYDLMVLGIDGNGQQSCNSGQTKCESGTDGQLVPITMVPSIACVEKGCTPEVTLDRKAKNGSGERSQDEDLFSSTPAFHKGDSPPNSQPPEVANSEGVRNNVPWGLVHHASTMDCQENVGEHTSVLQKQTAEQKRNIVESNRGSCLAASSNFSETESDDLRKNMSKIKESPSRAFNGEAVMGKDGMICCGGVRQVPVSGPGATLPVVDVSGPGSFAAKHYEELWRTSVSQRPSDPNEGTESEETHTASFHSASHRSQLDDTASGKLRSSLGQKFPDLGAQIPQSADSASQKLINLDVSLNVALKCFDDRQLMAILDYLHHLPIQFKTLQGSAIGETVNHLRKHRHPHVAKLAAKLVRLWRWFGTEHLKQSTMMQSKAAPVKKSKHRSPRNYTKMTRSSRRVARNARELTTIVQQLESVIRDL